MERTWDGYWLYLVRFVEAALPENLFSTALVSQCVIKTVERGGV